MPCYKKSKLYYLNNVLDNGKQNKVQYEQAGYHPNNGVDFLYLLFANFGNAVEDETCSYAVRYAVAERHKYAGEKCGNSFAEIIPIDFLKGRHHHNTDDNQSRCGCRKRNGADKCSEKCANGKTYGDNDAGQSGASARADAGGTFNICSGIRGTENRTYRRSGGIGEQSLVHLRFKAATGFHSALILFTKDTGTAAGADERTNSIKCVGNAESKNRYQNQRNF